MVRGLRRVALTSANEGTPVTMIEALAAGRPVVATAVGGVPDVVADGVDGFLVEPGDTAALAERLARLAADPTLRGRWASAAGRARWLGTPSAGSSTTSTRSTARCSTTAPSTTPASSDR